MVRIRVSFSDLLGASSATAAAAARAPGTLQCLALLHRNERRDADLFKLVVADAFLGSVVLMVVVVVVVGLV